MRAFVRSLLSRGWANCPTCKSVTQPGSVFCRVCLEAISHELAKSDSLHTSFQSGLRVRSLFLWDQTCLEIIPSLIYALKDGGYPNVYLWLARQFIIRNPDIANAGGSLRTLMPVLLPAPGRQQDHAETWAWALSQTGRACVLRLTDNITQQGPKRSQKSKSRSERRVAQHRLIPGQIEGIESLLKTRPIYFCDDVVTTGSTAMATLKLIDRCLLPEVFCIAYRPRFGVGRGE